MGRIVTPAQRERIVAMLEDGVPARQVAAAVHSSQKTVLRIRNEEDIPIVVRVGRQDRNEPDTLAVDEPEDAGTGSGSPWTPPDGYDLHAERPDQARWLSMLSAASSWELDRLRTSVCKVLGLSPVCSDAELTRTLLADRRTAEELAGAYIEARASLRKVGVG